MRFDFVVVKTEKGC